MRRLTRQRKSQLKKSFYLPVLVGAVLLAGGILFVILLWLERGARLDIPKLPDGTSGQFVFYDTLKKSGPTPTEGVIPVEDPRPIKPPKIKVAPKVHSPPPRPPSVTRKETTPAGTSAPGVKRKYAVQVAASKDRQAAEVMKVELDRKGYPVFIVRELVPEKGYWYRVRIGHYDTREKAAKMIKRLLSQERLEGFLVIEKDL